MIYRVEAVNWVELGGKPGGMIKTDTLQITQGDFACVVAAEAVFQVVGQANVVPGGADFTHEDIGVGELPHRPLDGILLGTGSEGGRFRPGLPGRSPLLRITVGSASLRYAGAGFVLRYAVADEAWRRGELNPCPDDSHHKRLHA